MNRRGWIGLSGLVAAGTLGLIFTAADPPGVQEVAEPFDAEPAGALTQWKFRCTLPRGLGDGLSGDSAVGGWKNSELTAKDSAYTTAAQREGRGRKWGAYYSQRRNEWTLTEGGVDVYSFRENCVRQARRTVRGGR